MRRKKLFLARLFGIVVAAGKQGRLGNFPHVLMEMHSPPNVSFRTLQPDDAICGFAVYCWSENSNHDIQNSHFYYMLLLN